MANNALLLPSYSLALVRRQQSFIVENDIKAQYGNASILKDSRVVFNICGNTHRLIVKINYDVGIIFVKFVGTHAEYDQVDAETINAY